MKFKREKVYLLKKKKKERKGLRGLFVFEIRWVGWGCGVNIWIGVGEGGVVNLGLLFC